MTSLSKKKKKGGLVVVVGVGAGGGGDRGYCNNAKAKPLCTLGTKQTRCCTCRAKTVDGCN